MKRRALGLAFVAVLAAAVPVAAGSCSSTSPCTPEEHGLGGAPALSVRKLPGVAVTEGECARPRLEVIASDAELARLYDELGANLAEAGADSGSPEYPIVDFARERVVVREGSGGEGIAWAVSQGETCIVGLLACKSVGGPPTCGVEVVAVDALAARVESRSCDPVGCGSPIQPPVTGRR